MAERQVLISLSASATDEEGQQDSMNLITSGTLTDTPRGYRLEYEENLDEDAPPQPITLLMEDGAVTMQRGGDYATGMVFAKDQRYEGQYHTPYGFIDMAVFCSLVRYRMEEGAGELKLRYQLDVSGQFAAMHELTLQILLKDGDAE